MMTLQRLTSCSRAFVALLGLSLCATACSSKSDAQVKRVDMEHKSWDYDQIRKARAAEAGEAPSATATTGDDDANCVIMTHDQMARAKSSGCRKMDPREGGGEDAYCCPR